MSVVLNLPPDKEAELRRRAAVTGKSVEELVLTAVDHELEERGGGSSTEELPYERWSEEFRAWIASRRSRNPHFDDSRESIYD